MEETDQETLIQEFVAQRVWAVVGASPDPEKYGHRVFVVLRRSGYVVYPVNPRHTEVEGERCYATVADLPERPGVVDLVVPPQVGMAVIRQCAATGIERIWLQPGAESAELLALARELGLRVVHDACAMVRRRRWPTEPGDQQATARREEG